VLHNHLNEIFGARKRSLFFSTTTHLLRVKFSREALLYPFGGVLVSGSSLVLIWRSNQRGQATTNSRLLSAQPVTPSAAGQHELFMLWKTLNDVFVEDSRYHRTLETMAGVYKQAKEDFVSGTSGSSITHVNLVSLVALVRPMSFKFLIT